MRKIDFLGNFTMRKYIGAIWGKSLLLVYFWCKNKLDYRAKKLKLCYPPTPTTNQYVPKIFPIVSSNFFPFLPDNLYITLDYRSKKSKELCVMVAILGKLTFWAFFTPNCCYNGTFSKGLKVNNFKNTIDYRAKKSKCPVL